MKSVKEYLNEESGANWKEPSAGKWKKIISGWINLRREATFQATKTVSITKASAPNKVNSILVSGKVVAEFTSSIADPFTYLVTIISTGKKYRTEWVGLDEVLKLVMKKIK